ncbi:MAG: hypothetical protein ISR96_12935, partial [Nitrospira sp.]|nr:hypothetical protein [Nitrospira sp.]
MSGLSLRNHVMYGSIELNYEQLFREEKSVSSRLAQNYTLGLRGFVLDPRLINFNTSGTLTHTSRDTGNNSTLRGIRLSVNLLEVSPRRWTGARRFIPNPIRLRFSNYADGYNSTNYGLSLIYSDTKTLFGNFGKKKKDEKKQSEDKQSEKKKDKKKKPTSQNTYPSLLFDYDKYKYESGAFKYNSDQYSLRARIDGKNYDYTLDFERFDQEGSTFIDKSAITLRSHHWFFKKETRRRINFNNFIILQDIDKEDQVFLGSALTWQKPFDKDTLSFSGNANYLRSSIGDDERENYYTSATGSYTKILSPGTSNNTSLSFNFGETESSTIHSERLSNYITSDLSRVFRSSGGVFVANTDKGNDYGADIQLSTKTRISTGAAYSFSALSDE